MINYIKGNLFESSAEAFVNTVNTDGIMGKGIALQFKKMFPTNFKLYKDECKNGKFGIGDLIVTRDQNILTGEKLIINFPTKTSWRAPSEYDYIEKGIQELIHVINKNKISSIAIPPLGSGNGGLQWHKVKSILESRLSDLECSITIYEPNDQVREVLNKERVKLTPARGMLLYMLFDLVRNGEFVSEFSSEKVCYFLQRFGGEEYFKLKYTPNFYGPYSGKVKHVLNYLNGSYIMGYGGKDKKPFDELSLLTDSESQVYKYINENENLKEIVEKTSAFLKGFYSLFGLELLSTVDFIGNKNKTSDEAIISTELANWSNRKKTLFSNHKFLEISINHLKTAQLLSQ